MKATQLRRLISGLLFSAVLSCWYMAFTLHLNTSQPGPPIVSDPPLLPAVSSRRPYFVLHVGPPKTATTSIQCGLEQLSGELAREDSYFFMGKRCPPFNGTMANGEEGIPGHHLMLGLNDANPQSRGFEKLKNRMAYHHARGNHMIFSIEAMSNHLEDRPETWKVFLSLFEGWNVRIVVAYRYYFDWIRSMYFQQHIGRNYRIKWPDQKGLAHPSFHEFLSYHLERWEKRNTTNDGHSWGQHLTLHAMKYFGNHFDDVQIFDLHQDGDVITNFICQMLPNASNVCRRLKQDALIDVGIKRESHSFDADRLAFAAYSAGTLNKKIDRVTAVKEVASQLRKTGDLSVAQNLACLTDEMASKFLNASLWFDDQVGASHPHGDVSTAFVRRTPQDLVEAFQSANRSGKFCEIDPDVVLRLPHWKTFITAMKPRRTKSLP